MAAKMGAVGHRLLRSPAEQARLVADYLAGSLAKDLVARFGVCANTVTKVLRRHGVTDCKSRAGFRQKRRHAVATDYFRSIDTEAKAYWLGFLCADGHVSKAETWVEVGLAACDADHLRKLCDAIAPTAQLREMRKNGFSGTPAFKVQINSRELCRDLIRQGVTRPGVPRHPPPGLPPELVRHYLRGLFDGDGCIFRGGTIYGTFQWRMGICGTLPCVEMFRRFSRTVTGTGARIVGPKHGIYYHNTGGNTACRALATALYEDSAVSLVRKRILYEQLCREYTPRPLLPPVVIDGVRLTVVQAARLIGIHPTTLATRLRAGWPVADALSLPAGQPHSTGKRLLVRT